MAEVKQRQLEQGSRSRETKGETETERHTIFSCIIQTQGYNEWQQHPYGLGYKLSYIITEVGQTPCSIIT